MSRNCLIYRISKEFMNLQRITKTLTEKEIIKRIKKFLPKSSAKYFEYTIHEHPDGLSLEWKTNTEARIKDEKLDGKYLLYAS